MKIYYQSVLRITLYFLLNRLFLYTQFWLFMIFLSFWENQVNLKIWIVQINNGFLYSSPVCSLNNINMITEVWLIKNTYLNVNILMLVTQNNVSVSETLYKQMYFSKKSFISLYVFLCLVYPMLPFSLDLDHPFLAHLVIGHVSFCHG